MCLRIFQLTTSHGGRPPLKFGIIFLSTFQLTTSHGGRRQFFFRGFVISLLSTHDLTRRSTAQPTSLRNPRSSFQLTTSHGGRRFPVFSESVVINLSTHDLTRRSTLSLPLLCPISLTFNSRPHTEVDFSHPPVATRYTIFQLTTSHGGRHNSAGIC